MYWYLKKIILIYFKNYSESLYQIQNKYLLFFFYGCDSGQVKFRNLVYKKEEHILYMCFEFTMWIKLFWLLNH